MRKILVVHENLGVINKIKETLKKKGYLVAHTQNIQDLESQIKKVKPYMILLDIRKIIDKKEKSTELLEKSIDQDVAKSYERLAKQMSGLQKIKGVSFESETLLLIDEIENEIGEIVRIGKINKEVLQFEKKDGRETDNKGKMFVEKKVYDVEDGINININRTKAIALVPLEMRYKTMDGIEVKNEYENRKISEEETKEIAKFTDETLEIIKNSLLKKPREVKEFEESYEELQILLSEIEYMKSEFITFVSHEIGTPLSIIKGNIELLIEGEFGKLNNEQKKRLNTVQKNIDRLTKIIRDTMELMKIENNKLILNKELNSISELAREIVFEVQIIAKQKEHVLDVDIEKTVPDIMFDKSRIRQVFTNIINNAIKYTPRKGKINVKVKKEDANVHIMVSDNGIGIQKEEQKNIFAKFYKVSSHLEDASGTGLGLAICKGIVDAHNGKIWVESKIGNGATFHIKLPIEVIN